MKVLITGVGGQLGRALVACAPIDAQVLALSSTELDITDISSVRRVMQVNTPAIVLNAAAYTAVDLAETNSKHAFAINAAGVGNLATSAAEIGAQLIHPSTDFVFDGRQSHPYRPSDRVSPLNEYGRSKLEGERLAGAGALIVRTAWVYSSQGSNFVLTMLKLMREREELRVVTDQIGTPTWATSLARVLWRLASLKVCGTLHYTDSGIASWYDFAVAIEEEARAAGLLKRAVHVVPINTSNYPTPAPRPSFSVLDKSETIAILGQSAPHWRTNLRCVLRDLATNA